MRLLKEFKPSILFLTKFLVLYLSLNFVYGLYISHYNPSPDPITAEVTCQTSVVLHLLGHSTTISDHAEKPSVYISQGVRNILSVYEGCNGINVMVIFLAFLLSFSRPQKQLLWFIPLGILVIHGANLLRITLLFYVSEYLPRFLYFTHKYLFTAIIYLAVFVLWYWWVSVYHKKPTSKD